LDTYYYGKLQDRNIELYAKEMGDLRRLQFCQYKLKQNIKQTAS